MLVKQELGVLLLQEPDKKEEALKYFNSALQHNPQHHQSLFNSAILMQEMGDPRLRAEAFNRLEKLHSMTPNDSRVYFNQAMLAMDDQRYAQAEQLLLRSISIEANFSGALFNLALMLSNNLNRPLDAYTHLQQLLHYHPDHTKGLTLLGDININVKKDLDAAEANYRKILSIKPNDVQAYHNLCVVYVERGDLIRGEQCLAQVHEMAPTEKYIVDHLNIVRGKIHKIQEKMKLDKMKKGNP